MNKTQRMAWYSLAIFSFSIVLAGYNFYCEFVMENLPESFFGRHWSVIVFFAIFIPAMILLRKKQSPVEVDSDERDILIRKKALVVSFTSVWILFIISILILFFAFGSDGRIAVWIFPLVILEVFFIAMIIYSIAILVQYGREGKDAEK